jgi:hypothetical protein
MIRRWGSPAPGVRRSGQDVIHSRDHEGDQYRMDEYHGRQQAEAEYPRPRENRQHCGERGSAGFASGLVADALTRAMNKIQSVQSRVYVPVQRRLPEFLDAGSAQKVFLYGSRISRIQDSADFQGI